MGTLLFRPHQGDLLHHPVTEDFRHCGSAVLRSLEFPSARRIRDACMLLQRGLVGHLFPHIETHDSYQRKPEQSRVLFVCLQLLGKLSRLHSRLPVCPTLLSNTLSGGSRKKSEDGHIGTSAKREGLGDQDAEGRAHGTGQGQCESGS